MFGWRSRQQPVPEEEAELPDLNRLREQELTILFKHSQSCPVSWAAHMQVKNFRAENPGVPVYTILVKQDRELSRRIAAATGVRHESPQVIVLRRGVVVADASHQDVTADFLTQALTARPDLV